MRIRTVKPEFFTHEKLFEAEHETGLPLRVAYPGLWCAADREGRFRWEPRRLKLAILPYDEIDFSRVLDALLTRGFLVKYRVGDAWFGLVPSFKSHQVINNREMESQLPSIADAAEVIDASATRASRVSHACPTRLVHAQGEGNMEYGREGNNIPIERPPTNVGVIERQSAPVPQEVCEADASRAPDEIPSPPFHDPLEPYPELCDFWEELLTYIRQHHPRAKFPRIRSKPFFEWRRTLAQLVALDGFKPEEVIAVFTWLYMEYRPSDAFDWREQIQSVAALRNIGRNDQTKFYGVFRAWKNWNQQAAQSDQFSGTYSNEIWRNFTKAQLEEMPGTLEWEAKRQRNANTARDGTGSTQD